MPAVDAPVRMPIVRARRSGPVFVIVHAKTDCHTIVALKPKPTRASTIHQPAPGQTKRTLAERRDDAAGEDQARQAEPAREQERRHGREQRAGRMAGDDERRVERRVHRLLEVRQQRSDGAQREADERDRRARDDEEAGRPSKGPSPIPCSRRLRPPSSALGRGDDGDSAARLLRQRHRDGGGVELERGRDVVPDPDRERLAERALVPEAGEVELQRLRLEAEPSGR